MKNYLIKKDLEFRAYMRNNDIALQSFLRSMEQIPMCPKKILVAIAILLLFRPYLLMTKTIDYVLYQIEGLVCNIFDFLKYWRLVILIVIAYLFIRK